MSPNDHAQQRTAPGVPLAAADRPATFPQPGHRLLKSLGDCSRFVKTTFTILLLMGFLFACSHQPSPAAIKLYEDGFQEYLEKRYSEALPLLKRASELGSGDADCQLGVMYELGYGVPTDPAEAFRCFERAAQRDSSGGQYRLGRCYQEGIGVTVDKRKALHWHRKAAAQDNRLAPYAIEDLAREGIK